MINLKSGIIGTLLVDNSTMTALGAGGVFTGVWIDTINIGVVTISVTTDQDSATNGLSVDWSNNGITKTQDDVFTISANTGKVFTFSPASRFIRIVYTNGAIAQSTFSLQTVVKQTGFKPSSHRIQDTIVGEDDAELIKSVITGLDDHGNFVNIRSSLPGNLRATSTPIAWDIVRDHVLGITDVSKFGFNIAVGATLEEVWDGSVAYIYMTSASTLYISSDDTNDDQIYEVTGLDANWDIQTVNVTANGFNFVALTGTWIRVFRVKNTGTTDNAGNIYISDDNIDVGGNGIPDDLDNCKAKILVGFNQTLMALWSVPTDMNAYLVEFYGSTSSKKVTLIELYVRPFGGVFQIKKIFSVQEGTSRMSYIFPLTITEKSDVVIKASTVGGGGVVAAGFDLWYQ